MKIYHMTRKTVIIIGIIIITLVMANLIFQNYILSAKVELLQQTIQLIIEEYNLQDTTIKQYIMDTNPALSQGRAAEISRAIIASARRNQIDPYLLASLAKAESDFTVTARSTENAYGICQLQPATFNEVSLGDNIWAITDNIEAGARYLRKLILRFGGNLRLAAAAYNCGPSRPVEKILAISGGYADQVLAGWQQLKNNRKELAKCYYTSPSPISKAGRLFAFSLLNRRFISSLNAVQMAVKPDFYRF